METRIFDALLGRDSGLDRAAIADRIRADAFDPDRRGRVAEGRGPDGGETFVERDEEGRREHVARAEVVAGRGDRGGLHPGDLLAGRLDARGARPRR